MHIIILHFAISIFYYVTLSHFHDPSHTQIAFTCITTVTFTTALPLVPYNTLPLLNQYDWIHALNTLSPDGSNEDFDVKPFF